MIPNFHGTLTLTFPRASWRPPPGGSSYPAKYGLALPLMDGVVVVDSPDPWRVLKQRRFRDDQKPAEAETRMSRIRALRGWGKRRAKP